jgi:hypothetical protein
MARLAESRCKIVQHGHVQCGVRAKGFCYGLHTLKVEELSEPKDG